MAISNFIRCLRFRRLIGITNNTVTLFSDTGRHLVSLQFLHYRLFVQCSFSYFDYELFNYCLIIIIIIIIILQNYIKSQSYASISTNEIKDSFKSDTKKPEKKLSRAMLMYLQRAKEHGSNRSILFIYIF